MIATDAAYALDEPEVRAWEDRIFEGDITAILHDLQRLLHEAELAGDLKRQGQILATISLGLQYNYSPQEATTAAQKALAAFEITNDAASRAIVMGRIGVSLAKLGESEASMQLFSSAQKLVQSLDDVRTRHLLEYRILNNLSAARYELRDWNGAREAGVNALTVVQQLDDPYEEAWAVANVLAYEFMVLMAAMEDAPNPAVYIGDLNTKLDEMRAFETRVSQEWPWLMSDVFIPASKALHASGRSTEAMELLRNGLDQLTELQYTRDIAEARLFYARIIGAQDKATEVNILAEVRAAAEATDDDLTLRDYHEHMSRHWEAAGEFEKALGHYELFRALASQRVIKDSDARAQMMAALVSAQAHQFVSEIAYISNGVLESHITDVTGATSLLGQRLLEDELTKLGNRRAFEQALSTPTLSPRAVIMIDLDHFKKVNDTYGHATGDVVLQRVSTILQASVRRADGDMVCRIGGEEFVVLPSDPRSAKRMADRIWKAIGRADWESVATGLRVTASIGVAVQVTDEPVEEAVRRADEAAYTAKRSGRNNVQYAN